MSKVLLINPGWQRRISRRGKRFNRAWPPLSLMICAASVQEKGFKATVIDGRVQKDWHRIALRVSEDAAWIVLTSSPLDRWQCPNLEVEQFIEIARSFPAGKLIIVGAHGSCCPEEMLQRTGARAVVVGEPEEVVTRLVSQKDWGRIRGLAHRVNGVIQVSGKSEPVDLAKLPMPAFDLMDVGRYHYELLGDRFFLFETSRGCPYGCRFCLKVMFGGPVRFKPVNRLLKEIERAVGQFGARTAYFIDLEFTMNRNHAMAICEALTERGYPLLWCCQTRADAVDPELLAKMKRAGCRLIHFGVESGSESVLKGMEKQMDLAVIEKGVRQAREAGIDTACFFLLGFPGETKADMEKTVAFSRKLNPTYASFHTATPYPGTGLHEDGRCVPAGPADCLSVPHCCAEHDPALLDSITRRAFKGFYLRPAYLVSRLRRGDVTSWLRQLRLFGGFVS